MCSRSVQLRKCPKLRKPMPLPPGRLKSLSFLRPTSTSLYRSPSPFPDPFFPVSVWTSCTLCSPLSLSSPPCSRLRHWPRSNSVSHLRSCPDQPPDQSLTRSRGFGTGHDGGLSSWNVYSKQKALEDVALKEVCYRNLYADLSAFVVKDTGEVLVEDSRSLSRWVGRGRSAS